MDTKFVNWDEKNRCFHDGSPEPWNLEVILAIKRHPVLEELIETLTSLWKAIGVSRVCVACFSGKITEFTGAKGCCGNSCSHLGVQGCLAKPLGCALFLCASLRTPWTRDSIFVKEDHVRLNRFLVGLERLAPAWFQTYYARGYLQDLNYPSPETVHAWIGMLEYIRNARVEFEVNPLQYTREFLKLESK